MTVVARLDLKMDADEKEIVSRAATLMGTTMAAFVRSAASEKARELIDRESRITMTTKDFRAFARALNGPFEPNKALRNAMTAASKVKRA